MDLRSQSLYRLSGDYLPLLLSYRQSGRIPDGTNLSSWGGPSITWGLTPNISSFSFKAVVVSSLIHLTGICVGGFGIGS